MYKVEFTESAVKQLKKLDKQTVRVIKNWVIKNLVNTPDPRLHGKALKGNLKGIWRYRVGDYRLFASIEEDIITIRIFEIGHRMNIPWWRSHPIHENRATESICTEPCNPLLRATKSIKRATSNYEMTLIFII